MHGCYSSSTTRRIRLAPGVALADEACEVIKAASGGEALEVLAGTWVDVVLLDLMLPGVDGLEICPRPRSCGDLPTIIMTAKPVVALVRIAPGRRQPRGSELTPPDTSGQQ
jgi:DNA-binding response OmpR family regulator